MDCAVTNHFKLNLKSAQSISGSIGELLVRPIAFGTNPPVLQQPLHHLHLVLLQSVIGDETHILFDVAILQHPSPAVAAVLSVPSTILFVGVNL